MIFVTGATGFLGEYICRHFLKMGYKIRALRRSSSKLSEYSEINNQVEWVEGDILDLQFLNTQLKGVEYVVHCAAVVSFQKSDKELMEAVNVGGTANVVNACLEANVKKLIFVSSIAAIGKKKASDESNENTTWDFSRNISDYGRTKYLAEIEVWRGIAEGLNAVIVNPSVIIGPGPLEKSSVQLFKYVLEGNPFYIDGLINLVDVRDVSEIISKLISSDVQNERYILNAEAISYHKFFSLIAQNFNRKAPNIKLGKVPIYFGIFLSNALFALFKRKSILANELPKQVNNKQSFQNSKIRTALSYKFRPLEATIRWSCQEIQEKMLK